MILTKDNFLVFAAKQYDMTLNTTEDDFASDLKRFLYVKRLLNKFNKGDELKARLVLNHIIVLFNCFGEAAVPMLFQRLEGLHAELKPFIIALNYMPNKVIYDNKVLYSSDIPMNSAVISELRKI